MNDVLEAIEALETALATAKASLTAEEALALGTTIYQIEQCSTHWKREIGKLTAPAEEAPADPV